MALAVSRLGDEAQRLPAELWSLSTFLQNMSTLCHHASRFPENPEAEGLEEMVAAGALKSSSQGCHTESNHVYLSRIEKKRGHQGWGGNADCFVAEPLGTGSRRRCAELIAQCPEVLSRSS